MIKLETSSTPKYSKIRTRIEGLKNHNYIPCPYPDCESFGHINDISKNVLKCNNEHIFNKFYGNFTNIFLQSVILFQSS